MNSYRVLIVWLRAHTVARSFVTVSPVTTIRAVPIALPFRIVLRPTSSLMLSPVLSGLEGTVRQPQPWLDQCLGTDKVLIIRAEKDGTETQQCSTKH